ncbi:MAG: hypothetical protein U0P81_06420 [Holophagaceae bacterium]
MRSGAVTALTLGEGVLLAWAGPRLPAGGPLAGAALAAFAGAWLLDVVLARPGDLPVYRRHLLACGLATLAASAGSWASGGPGPGALAGLAGASAALALRVLPALRGRRLEDLSWSRGTRRRPDPARPLILVADPHWGATLTGLDATLREHPGCDWLFLGDVFDVWVGLPAMETAAQRGFLDWVAARRAEGAWVGLWMGNREYFLDRHAGAFDLLGEGVGGGLEAEALAFEHGDWINPDDARYRLWNVASRSGPFWLLVRLLPAAAARALAASLERRLRTTNLAYRLAFPAAAFEAAAAATGGRAFVTGHFHTLERRGEGTALPWAHDGRFWVWREGRVEPLDPDAGSTSDDPADPNS